MRLALVLCLVLACLGCGSSDGSQDVAQAPRECVDDAAPAVVDGSLQEGNAAWVRFCPPAEGRAGWVLAPDVVVEGQSAAELVASWRDDDLAVDCVQTTRGFEIQIGWSEGTVSRLGADNDLAVLDPDAECAPSRVAASLVSAVGVSRDATYAATTPQPWPECPGGLALSGLAADGASAVDLGAFDERGWSRQPILHVTAARALVCSYAGSPPRYERGWELIGADAEAIRVALQTRTQPGIPMCDMTPRPSFVIVLEDLTGTRRAVSIDGPACGAVSATIGTPPGESYLGIDQHVRELLTPAD